MQSHQLKIKWLQS